jgi:glycosyltransferase involved in cell wall biosynthesis
VDVAAPPGVYLHRNLGPNSDTLLRLYAEADVFVLPTHADCFTLAVIEAMASRLPVVACPVGGISELVLEGETGFLVPVGDVSALAGALSALILSPQRRAAMGARGRLVAEARFNSAINGRQILSIMQCVAERPDSRRQFEHRQEIPVGRSTR